MITKNIFETVDEVVSANLCHGCGACVVACPENAIVMQDIVDAGVRPKIVADSCNNCGNCISVCSGINLEHNFSHWHPNIHKGVSQEWGPVLEVWEGHSLDPNIRFKGSSGGVITALSKYCVTEGGFASVLHAIPDLNNPLYTISSANTTEDEILDGAGSRYCPVAVLSNLRTILKFKNPSVLIGKPCEIASFEKIVNTLPQYKGKIGLKISIVCGGTPSTSGTLKIIDKFDVDKSSVLKVKYRGEGWPGQMKIWTLKSVDDISFKQIPYQVAWNETLTHFRPFRCLICPDPSGEFSDITCGDPWYRKPSGGEHGSTLIIVRTEKGSAVLSNAIRDGAIEAKRISYNKIEKSQIGVLQRRRRALPKILALMLTCRKYPVYKGFNLVRSYCNMHPKNMVASIYRAFILVLKQK